MRSERFPSAGRGAVGGDRGAVTALQPLVAAGAGPGRIGDRMDTRSTHRRARPRVRAVRHPSAPSLLGCAGQLVPGDPRQSPRHRPAGHRASAVHRGGRRPCRLSVGSPSPVGGGTGTRRHRRAARCGLCSGDRAQGRATTPDHDPPRRREPPQRRNGAHRVTGGACRCSRCDDVGVGWHRNVPAGGESGDSSSAC